MAVTRKDLRDMIEVVTLAIPREIESYHFYMKAMRKSKSDISRNLFRALADEERGHEAVLRNLLEEFKSKLKALDD